MRTTSSFGPRLFASASATVLVLVLAVAACGDDSDGSTTVTLPDPAAAVERARADFCDATEQYIAALDTYGQVLDQPGITVGDVQAGGEDLVAAEADAVAAAEDYDETVAAAEATAAAAAATATTSADATAEETTTTTFPPLASSESIERVQSANAAWEDTVADVDASTPLAEAEVAVTSAAYQLEVATGLLFADAGCIDDPGGARAQVTAYVTALQTDLAEAGYYTGAIDGIYGPETIAAVQQLQADSGLPVTGLPDAATQEALNRVLGDQESASIAALQGILTALGFYTGPIDGVWSQALADAVVAAQTEAGQEPTGTITPETLAALQAAIAARGEAGTTTTDTTADPGATTVPPETTTTSAG